VRGEVDAVIKSEITILGYKIKGIENPVHPDDIIGRADIVGPAPATPDEGLLHQLAATEGVLAAVEAERDALARLLDQAVKVGEAFAAALAKLTHEFVTSEWIVGGQPCCDLLETDEDRCWRWADHPIHQTPAVIRRALSVEATGTEGGGGRGWSWAEPFHVVVVRPVPIRCRRRMSRARLCLVDESRPRSADRPTPVDLNPAGRCSDR